MTKAFGRFTLFTTMILAMLAYRAVTADAAGEQQPRYVSATIQAQGSRSVELYHVPTGMTLFVRETCQEHPAMYVEVGDRGDRISYNGHGCTRFDPGFAVPSGEVLNCVNKSGQERTCVLTGFLEPSAAHARASGARFYDVDRELGNKQE